MRTEIIIAAAVADYVDDTDCYNDDYDAHTTIITMETKAKQLIMCQRLIAQ